jgi:hypothetical protein
VFLKKFSNRQGRHRPVARPFGATGSRLCIVKFLFSIKKKNIVKKERKRRKIFIHD